MKLFISYSRDDESWVREFGRKLREDAYHDVWIDGRIPVGQDWWDTILDNIESCDCFIYIMTTKAIESRYCQAELQYALALNRPIVPLMLKQCEHPESLNTKRIQFAPIDKLSFDQVMLKVEQGLNKIQIDLEHGHYSPQVASRPELPSDLSKSDSSIHMCILPDDYNYSTSCNFFADIDRTELAISFKLNTSNVLVGFKGIVHGSVSKVYCL